MQKNTTFEIKNTTDIENLVISLIFRMKNGYTEEKILNLTFEYLSSIGVTYSKVKLLEIIDNKLDLLQRNNFLKCENGIYTNLSAKETLIRKTNLVFNREEKTDLGILN